MKEKKIRAAMIVLRNGVEVAINYSSKGKCECGKDVWDAVSMITHRHLRIELVSLSLWDVHECKIS